ncbi:hypothetical protein [Alteromonas sp. C1M14]|uniref:hypothetical protein n=1 Tax=Alteromonas sp. C1M14 TaxID=2841567 RepID=UPI001C09B9EA|nr:hypothetical protein [Alteromonas sp. C1M14]MBU2977505.1 hypothetical protein [Alteromonas sp. C1M14]
MNRPPHHEKIHLLALEIVNAVDSNSESGAYDAIRDICETHEGTPLDHPFQWETLGDFTYTNNEKALSIYFKALELAKKSNLIEYIASINLAIACQYQELEEFNKSWEFANFANEAAKSSSDLALKHEINEILLETSKYT